MMDPIGSVLVIDDELGPREAIRMILKDRYAVRTAFCAEEGIKLLSLNNFSVVIMDIKMPGIDGITALQEIKKLAPDTEVVMVTAYASLDTAKRAIHFGAFDYIIKPFDKDEFMAVVNRGFQKCNEKREKNIENIKLKELVHKRTKALKITERMLRELFENANDGIIITDSNGIIVDINQKACEIHGCLQEEALGQDIKLFEHEGNMPGLKELMKRMKAGKALLFESIIHRKDNSRIFLEISAKAIKINEDFLVQFFERDVTDKKRLQDQLFQSQKMESLGNFAGGIAHDFNNVLSSILGHTELVIMCKDITPEIENRMKIIEVSARQASKMVSSLLSFSRKDSFMSVPFNVNVVIEDTLKMISRLISDTITVRKELDLSIPQIEGDENQMSQVIMNLVINAKDAIPLLGEISIATRLVDTGDSEQDQEIRKQRHVSIIVKDTGTGIPEEQIPNVFEPFYTTKEKGKGTGLGLAIVYGIVKNHGGHITIDSAVGLGTTFKINLPVP